MADETQKGVKVQHEPKRITNKGAPDFKVTKSGLILGYVENKKVGEPLDKVLKSEQIAKYKTLSQNIVVTDYLHFAWINKDGIQRVSLCHDTDLEERKFRLRDDRVDAVRKLLHGFFSTAPQEIGESEELALALSIRSRFLRDYLDDELVRQEKEHQGAKLYGLYEVFQKQVFHELKLTEFADAFAQMLAYGLFLARLNSDAALVTLRNADEFIPGSFQLIQELVGFLPELEKPEYRDVRWVVEEVLSIVNGLDLNAIHEDLSFRQRKAISRKVRAANEEEHRLFERDPFIERRVKDMIGNVLSDDDFSEKYAVKSNRDWNIKSARESLRSAKNWQNKIIRCAYRPFDNPYCFFGTEFMDYPRRELLDHVADEVNKAGAPKRGPNERLRAVPVRLQNRAFPRNPSLCLA